MTTPEPSKSSAAPSTVRKTIGYIGSISLLVNNVTGGSMVVLPQTFHSAGWVLPILCCLGVALLACVCGVLLIEAMALVPGNHRFAKRLEYTNLADLLLPRKLYWIVQAFYQLSILAQNVAMIVQSVQVMDFTLVALTGYSCALPQLAPNFAFRCSYPGGFVSDGISPFGDWYLVSLGWIVTAVLVLPLGFINLDDNDAVQQGGFVAVLAIVAVWCGLSFSEGTSQTAPPAFGGNYDTLMGSILFNFAINYTLPSWINEKKDRVPVVRSLLISLLLSAVLFIVLGICGAVGFPPPANNQTLLNQIYIHGGKLGSVTFFLFPACVNLTTIPVNSIMQRYNLQEAGVCGRKWALFWGVISPWLIAIPLYTGRGYETLVSWSGLVLISSVNFVLPPIFYLLALKKYGRGPNALRTVHDTPRLTAESASRHGPSSGGAGSGGPSRRKSFFSVRRMRTEAQDSHARLTGGDRELETQMAPLSLATTNTKAHTFQAIVDDTANTDPEVQVLAASSTSPPLDAAESKAQEPQVATPPLLSDGSAFRRAGQPLQPIRSLAGAVIASESPPLRAAAVLGQQPIPSAAEASPDVADTAGGAAAGSGEDDEWGDETEADRIAFAEWEQRQTEKEAARRARVLRRLRHRRDKLAALQANPDEVAQERELEPMPQADLTPPVDWRSNPLGAAYWLIALPWHLVFRLTVPHLTDPGGRGVADAGWSAAAAAPGLPSTWPLRLRLLLWCPVSLLSWSVAVSFGLVWSASVIARVTGFHAFALGIVIVGVGIRAPHLLSEYRAYRAGRGDLNRIFANTVWQMLVCLPLPWLLSGGGIVGATGTHVIYTSSLSIVALTLFLLVSMLLILLLAYHWIVVRAVALAAALFTVAVVLVTFLLDYSIIMQRTSPFCDRE